MITKMQLDNFKALKTAKLTLGNLTFLAGRNGTGKSCIIQALLLLRQSYLSNESFSNGLIANGQLIKTGKVSNLFNVECEKENLMNIFLRDESSLFKWSISYENSEKDFAFFTKKSAKAKKLSLFTNNFQYISSFRIPLMKTHDKSELVVEFKNQISKVEGQCEMAVHFLSYNKNKEVPVELRHPRFKEKPFLIDQVNAWMGEFNPNIDIVIIEDGRAIELRFRFYKEDTEDYTPAFIPENVSYGISQVLPILIAVLSAQKESLILLENPESHLHPNGQSTLVELLAKAAQYGIQIIVETHSDHIINGTLVQCKRFRTEGQGINRENVRVYYFDRSEKGNYMEANEIVIAEGENIYNPPNGFFDQYRKDLRELLGF